MNDEPDPKADKPIGNRMTILYPNGECIVQDLFHPEPPGSDLFHDLIKPLLGGAEFEHVAFLTPEGEHGDMFVDDLGAIKRLPRNQAATIHYRRNWLTKHPGADPEDLPAIYGVAIVFDKRVWF